MGMTGSTAAISDAADPTLFVRILVVEVFASIMGLFGLIGEYLRLPISLHFLMKYFSNLRSYSWLTCGKLLCFQLSQASDLLE